MTAALHLVHAGASRRQASAADPQTSASEADELLKDAGAMTDLVGAIKEGKVQMQSSWDLVLMWVVARKAVFMPEHEAWMLVRCTP